tara:strand:- start:288 stop:455 length:168 start_codon:yes stop_codon:yes gene_type:complete
VVIFAEFVVNGCSAGYLDGCCYSGGYHFDVEEYSEALGPSLGRFPAALQQVSTSL